MGGLAVARVLVASHGSLTGQWPLGTQPAMALRWMMDGEGPMPISVRELEERPPREPLVSLAAIVRDWEWRFPRLRRDTVVTYCAEAPSLRVAINRAVDSIRPNGKMHHHQSRVPKAARDQLGENLQENMLRIRADIKRAHSPKNLIDPFDLLHDWVDACAVRGIGPVTVYDVATRIGAHPSLNAEPTSLYLHAGCRAGWLAMVPDPDQWKREERVLRRQMPVELQHLPADDIEDMCCAYRRQYETLEDRGTWPQEEVMEHE